MIGADLKVMFHALSALDSQSRAATELPPHGNGPLEAADSPALGLQAPSHIDGGAPREGINLILVGGRAVRAKVINYGYGCYTATQEDFDLGMPTCIGRSAVEALKDLQEILEDREEQS